MRVEAGASPPMCLCGSRQIGANDCPGVDELLETVLRVPPMEQAKAQGSECGAAVRSAIP